MTKVKTAPLFHFPFYPLFFFSKAPKSINREAYLMYWQVEIRVKLLYTNCVRVWEHCLPKSLSYLVRNWELSSGGIHTYLGANHQSKWRVSSSQIHLLSFLSLIFFHSISIPISIPKYVLFFFLLPCFQFGPYSCSPCVCLNSTPYFGIHIHILIVFSFWPYGNELSHLLNTC